MRRNKRDKSVERRRSSYEIQYNGGKKMEKTAKKTLKIFKITNALLLLL